MAFARQRASPARRGAALLLCARAVEVGGEVQEGHPRTREHFVRERRECLSALSPRPARLKVVLLAERRARGRPAMDSQLRASEYEKEMFFSQQNAYMKRSL